MGPVGRVPPTLQIMRTKCIWHPLQLLQLAVVFPWALREAYSASRDLLDKFKGRMKKEQGAMGGDREGTKEEKEGGSSPTPREGPLQLFSRGCAHKERKCAENYNK